MVAFAADASGDTLQFAAKAMSADVAARRFTCLRSWDVDTASLAKVVSVHFQGTKLFGEALDPLLVETRGKRKILPTRDGVTRARGLTNAPFVPPDPTPHPIPRATAIHKGSSYKPHEPVWQPKKPAYKSRSNNPGQCFPPKGGKQQ